MAGTLTISTLSDGTNSTSATNCIQGSARAWVNCGYVSGSMTTRASYNVSSVTRTSAGLYVVNLTNALPDTNFVALCTTSDDLSAVSTSYIYGTWPTNETTSQVTVQAASTISGADRTYMGVAIFR
jgi:hypothetical protein